MKYVYIAGLNANELLWTNNLAKYNKFLKRSHPKVVMKV